MHKPSTGGGWHSIWYTLQKAWEVGPWSLWSAMSSRNACKTCALGMGGQRGGMVNEGGAFPEVCKKSLQAMAADMQGAIKSEFWSTYSIPQMAQFSPREMETCGRIVEPVVYERSRGQYYRPISWEEAMGRIARKLQAIAPDESFWYFSGRSSNEAAFLLQIFARLYGTNNVNNCSYYCHQASGVGLQSSIGSGTATVDLEDIEQSDCVFVIGGNPASNHPRLMRTLMGVRRRGGEVIVINPIRETGLINFSIPSDMWSLFFGSEIASLYVQPHIGGDLALLTGIAKRIDEIGATDPKFLADACDGAEAWLAQLRAVSWDEIYARSGVGAAEIEAIASRYAKSKAAVFSWTMGITHHAHGVENVQAIANLALMRGMVGRKNAGLLPIRGHSNVQGIGSMGVTPKLKDAILEKLQSEFGLTLPTTPGLDTMACVEGSAAGKLKFGLCLGGNLYGSNPDSTFADQALSSLEMLVMMNTTLNTGHARGLAEETIILPVLARDEEPQPTTQESMFNFIRLSDGGTARHVGPRSEVQVVAELAEMVLGAGPLDWRSMRDTGKIREAIARVVPGYEKINGMEKTKQEFHVEGRVFHTPKFPTATGRAKIHVHSLPEIQGRGDGELRLMTLRSEGQFNTVVYEEEDVYRGQDRRDIILMHPDDVARLGLKAEQRVTVRSAVGSLPGILVRAFDAIRPGNAAMYYPESNVLVPRASDPKSKTPAFKCIVVTLEAEVTTQSKRELQQVT